MKNINRRTAAMLSAAVAVTAAAAVWGLLSGCDGGIGIALPDPANRTWVATEPIQCLGNPWEQDWLAHHGYNYDAYPRDQSGQEWIVREYYAGFGVEVSAIVSVPRYEYVCLACICPRGDTYYLLVRDGDVEVMVGFGYRIEGPRPWLSDTTFPLGDYGFTGYDTARRTVMAGRLTFLRHDSTLVSGSWDLSSPTGTGPRVGNGVFAGSVEGDTVILNLDPQIADNNLFLWGRMWEGTYAGRWELVEFRGVMQSGTFVAHRLRR